jgi:5-bromo-4-chloroindolyl phosphate hydrolysis protein
MADLRKEMAGGVAALGLFAGGLAAGIPVVFAGAAAAAAFWAAWTLMPRGRQQQEAVLPSGVTQESLDSYIGDCLKAVARLEKVGKALEGSPVRAQIREVITLIDRILDDCRQDPSDIRVEPQLPALLDMLASMLERYEDVVFRASSKGRTREQLKQIEEAVSTSLRWLGDLEQRMLHNDIMDGTAQAQTLIQVMKSQMEETLPPGDERR